MKDLLKLISLFALLGMLIATGCTPDEPEPPTPDPEPVYNPQAVSKTNDMKVYMHYMPWFHSKDVSGYWGSHWTMANRNPDNVTFEGKREIAAHYYPLIGPYDSSDPDLVDYHLLLMKYAGIDGVLIDWYGSFNVLDYDENLVNSNALIEGIERTGLDFSIVYEEFTAEEVARRREVSALEAAQTDMRYMQENYFPMDEYIFIGDKPLLLTFGPRFFRSGGQWTSILAELSPRPAFLPLWNFTHLVGENNATGEFAWVDFDGSFNGLRNFYTSASDQMVIGSAYPGFHDFYAEGGWGTSYGFVDHQDGQTFETTLQLAQDANLDYLQLVTWNDFGEGTMIEPTEEFQYMFLEMIQDFTGVTYGKSELEAIFDYYSKRKELKGNPEAQNTLDDVFVALIELDVTTAKGLLESL